MLFRSAANILNDGRVVNKEIAVSLKRAASKIRVSTAYTNSFSAFAGGTISTLYTYTGTTGDWDVVTNNPEHLAQADDNGFAKMTGEYYGSSAALISGKIDLTDAHNPILSFSTFNYYTQVTGPDYNNIDVYVCERGGEWVLEKSVIVNNAADQNRWGIVSVDLNKYAGKTIQLMFNATNYSYDTTTIDQVRIASGVDHNLTIGALSAPDTAEPNSSFEIGRAHV